MAWPNIKLGKAAKTFSYLIPIAGSSVAEGLLYDAPLLGLGIKWGLAIAVAIFAVFFAGMTIATLEDNKSNARY